MGPELTREISLALTGAPAVAPVMRTDHGLTTGEISLHHEDYIEVDLQVSIDREVAYRGLAVSLHATLADDFLEIAIEWVRYEPRRLFGRRRLSDFDNYEGRQLWIDSQVALTMDALPNATRSRGAVPRRLRADRLHDHGQPLS